MASVKFEDYIGKKISKETLEEFDFYHYINGKCPEYVDMMKEKLGKYDEKQIKNELPKDCWVTRKYVPEGCCITANAVLAFELEDEYTIKSITYMVEYVHAPGDFVPYIDIGKNVGNWYGFQGLSTPYMVEEYFEKIVKDCE